MKKQTLYFISLMLCAVLCAGCAEGTGGGDAREAEIYENTVEMLAPSESVSEIESLPEESFYGDFANDSYTAHIEEDEDGNTVIIISSGIENAKRTEWTITGFIGSENLRMNYTDALKETITVDSSGNDTDRETDYENGVGRIQFSDADHFEWENSYESVDNSVFSRTD